MKIKYYLSSILFILLFCTLVNVQGAEDIKIIAEGYELETDAPPVIKDNRVMVPVRAIFECVGAELTWESDTKTLTGTKGSHIVVMTVGDNSFTIDGEEHTMDTPPCIIEERLFAPARYVAESFDFTVQWDSAARTVNIYLPAENTTSVLTTEETTEETTLETTTLADTTTQETTSTPVSDVSDTVISAIHTNLQNVIKSYSLGIANSINGFKLATIRSCKSNWDGLAKTSTDKKYVNYCKQFYDRLANTAKRIDNVYSKKKYQGVMEIANDCKDNKDKLVEYANRFLRCKDFAECKETLDEMQKFYSSIKTRYYEYE